MLSSYSSAPQNPLTRKINVFGAAPKQNRPVAPTILLEKPADDRILFGRKGAEPPIDVPMSPTLNRIPWGAPVQVPVVSVRTLKPENPDVPPEKAEVFEIVLDVTKTALQDEEGNPQLWPGHQLRIKPDIPDTIEPEYAEYLEAMQHTDTLPKDVNLRSPEDIYYVMSRPYSVADVEKTSDGRVLATLVVKRHRFEKDGQTQLGLRSNQMARKKPGELLKITGAARNDFTLPPRDANMLIFGTGISNVGPLKYMVETRLDRQSGKVGQTCHYAGYKSHQDTIATELYEGYEKNPDKRFHYAEAFSREPWPGQPSQHIQDLIEQDSERILKLLLDPKTYVYICGIKDVETGVEKTLLKVAREKSIYTYWRVQSRIEQMKKNDQWRVEGVRSPDVKPVCKVSGAQRFLQGVQRFFLNWWKDLRARWKKAFEGA